MVSTPIGVPSTRQNLLLATQIGNSRTRLLVQRRMPPPTNRLLICGFGRLAPPKYLLHHTTTQTRTADATHRINTDRRFRSSLEETAKGAPCPFRGNRSHYRTPNPKPSSISCRFVRRSFCITMRQRYFFVGHYRENLMATINHK